MPCMNFSEGRDSGVRTIGHHGGRTWPSDRLCGLDVKELPDFEIQLSSFGSKQICLRINAISEFLLFAL